MKKIFLLALIVSLTAGMASAQVIKFGLKGGLNYSKLKFDDVSNVVSGASEYSLMEDESFQSFHIGVMSRIKVFNMYLQPELYFNTSGGKVLIEDMSGTTTLSEVRQVKYNKIDVPVLIGMKFGPVRVNAGPVASIMLSESNEIEDIIPEMESLSKSASFGYQAGVGIDFLKFLTLDYRYEGSLSKWGDKITVAGSDYAFDSRGSMHMVSLGIFF
jgi:Outer membrane protein beta-barrel domain